MEKSKRFSLSSYDLKSIGLYILVILATGVAANLVGLQEMLTDFLGGEVSGLLISILGIILKKFIQDYSK